MKTLLTTLIALAAAGLTFAQDDDGKLRIIAFGAHPDDAEFQIGGTAIKWAEAGHHVKLVSVTNGDIGHWGMAGGPLAKLRTSESAEAAKRMGVASRVLDIHDGELLPTLENRQTLVRLIREWNADIVFSHRPNDYHPDHRYTGILVQDAAFMVMVPHFCPDVPHLKKNPVFMYYPDGFQKPNPFKPDIAISIDDVFDKKVQALDALESQVYDGGATGNENTPKERFKDDPERRLIRLKQSWENRHGNIADRFRDTLIEWYGEEAGNAVKTAEAFELCEYGSRPTKERLKELFPFFGD